MHDKSKRFFCRFTFAAFTAVCLTARAGASSLDDALALCRRTYEYVAKPIPANEAKRFAQEMAVDAKWAATAKTPAERAIVEKVVRRLRRRILFAHPDLQFDRLLCVQRDVPYSRFNHMIDQYLGRFSHAGPGLAVIENWRTFPEKKLLLDGKLPTGCVLNPDLHWDADRVIFAFCDHTRKPEADAEALKVPKVDPSETLDRATVHRRYFIYECAIDGSWVRQLTGGPGDPMETAGGRQTVLIEDMDPCYLPDGEKALRAAIAEKVGADVAAQPFDALVNRAEETKSRVLWLCNVKDRDALLALCRKSLKPHPAKDVQGTCGRNGACECNSCWVRRGGYNVPR